MKKFLLTMMTLCVSLTMWAFGPDTVEWTDDNRPESPEYDNVSGLYYYLNEEGEAVITYQVASEQNYAALNVDDYTLPSTVGGYNVVSVGPWAFYHAPFTGKLTIPGSMLYINECSFAYCEKLEEVEFEYDAVALADLNAVAYNSSFIGCDAVKTIVLRRDVTVSTSSKVVAPFSYVQGMETVYIGENVTSIPNYMFRSNYAATLKYVISDAPEPPALGTSVFANANSELTFYTKADYLNTYKDNSKWVEEFGGKENMHAYDGPDPDEPVNELAFYDNGLYFEPNFGDDGEEDGTCSIIEPQGDDVYEGQISIPSSATNSETGVVYSVNRIARGAFADQAIEGELLIPYFITNMGPKAFANCTGITKVTYEHSSVELYEENTESTDQSFSGCSGVTDVYLNRNITLAATNGLVAPFCYMTSVQHVFIGHMVTYIPTYMFRNTGTASLEDVVCYASVPPAVGLDPFGAKSPSTLPGYKILWVWDQYYEDYEEADIYQTGSDWDRLEAIEDSDDYYDMPYPFDDTTGISIISADSKSAKVSGIYNIAGQRVSESAKGLLIKDGKKVLVK